MAISDEKLSTVHAKLKPAFGTLEVKATPGDASGANVLLDEENVGEAVWDIRGQRFLDAPIFAVP